MVLRSRGADGQSNWIIPAITAVASLLGAVIGAVATYWTSKKAHERESKRQEHERADKNDRRQSALLREAAIRFVTTMTDLSVASVGLTQISCEWGEVADKLAVAMAPNLRHHTIEDFNREINDFVNRVRRHMNVEPHTFNVIDEHGLEELLSFPAAGR